MSGVVACPHGGCVCGQRRVEVIGRAFLALPGRHQPWDPGVDPHRTAPALDLHLEQHLIVDRGDPLPRGFVVGEAVSDLGEQRMADVLQRRVRARDRQGEILSQAAERGAGPSGHRQRSSSTPPTASSSARVIPASIATRDARLPSSSLNSSRIPDCISSRRASR